MGIAGVPDLLAELNARVRELANSQTGGNQQWDFRCECGDRACKQVVAVTLVEFDALRAAGAPLLAEGHALGSAPAARRKARGLREDAAALRAEAQLQRKRARGELPATAHRPLLLEVPAPDFFAALDLQVRLQATAPSRVVGAADPTVEVECPRSQLRPTLRALSGWLDESITPELEIRVDQRPYTLHRHAHHVLRWREAIGEELDDIEPE